MGLIVACHLNPEYNKQLEMHLRVYSTDGISPTIHCVKGGNTQPMILEVCKDVKDKDCK